MKNALIAAATAVLGWPVSPRSAARLALAGGALAVSYCTWGMEETVYLPGPVPQVLSLRFEQMPSDADLPVDWRMHPAPARTHGCPR